MKKTYLTIALIFCAFTAVQAQNSFTAAYSVGIPTKDLHSFIGNTSFRGAIIDFQSMVNPNIGLGLSLGINTFYSERNYDSYTVDNITISGKQWRYSNHVPILINANYHFKPDHKANPFIGLGLGTMYSRRNTDMYIYTLEQTAWNFNLQPMAGIMIKTDKLSTINISARYNFGLQAGNELKSDQSYLSLNLGLTFDKL